MPLYEYQCDACGHRFEVIQKFSDPLVDTCPKCGSPVRKLMSSPAIQFKGSGFYITDYAKKDYTAATKADTDTSTKDAKDTKESKDGKESKDAKESKGAKESKDTKESKSEKTSSADKSASGSSTSESTTTSNKPSTG